MADGLTMKCDAAPLVAKFRLLVDDTHMTTLAASRQTAENIAAEARARAPRRRGRITKAQEARPPIEDTITVEQKRADNGRFSNGFIVSVSGHSPEATRLPWYLEFGTRNMDAQPFFLASARLETEAHRTRVMDALKLSIQHAGLGGRG